ncbi:MAG TPA: biopolymer transporter ExbD [Phycisphaerales bacterium]|nr:biopolymer transporter ExbD [Phycisphaerales bacterium]
MLFANSNQRRGLNRAALNLSSMIDVTFLLLIYFIVTTVFIAPEDLLSPALKVEEGTSSVNQDFEPQVVTVTMQGTEPAYVIGGLVIMNRKQFADTISKLPREPGIIIRVQDNVPVGFAIAAIQESRNAGFERVTYVPASD